MPKLRKAAFVPLVNQIFHIHPGDGRRIPVKLASITSHNMSPLYESFTLNFDPPPGEAALPDDSYLMENETLGQAVIFISPTPGYVPDPRIYYYEAVFNVYIGEEDEAGSRTF
jgi:hypothetical protein